MNQKKTYTVDCGLGMVFLVLLVMKLGGWTTISWWWVFAPFLVPLSIMTFLGLALVIAMYLDDK